MNRKIIRLIISIALIIVILLTGCEQKNIKQKDKTNKNVKGDSVVYSGTDDLGRELVLPGDNNYNNLSNEKQVGIFYFLNHGNSTTAGPHDISKILEKDPKAYLSDSAWITAGGGSVNRLHWWGEPIFGYYRNLDVWVKERDIMSFV